MNNCDLGGDQQTPRDSNEEQRREPTSAVIMAKIDSGLRRRKRAEKRFQTYGLISIGIALSFLAIMFGSIFLKGHSAFFQASIRLPVTFDAGTFDKAKLFPGGVQSDEAFNSIDFDKVLKSSLRELFPDVVERRDLKALYKLLSDDAESDLRDALIADSRLIGHTVDIWLQCSADVDSLLKVRQKDQLQGDQLQGDQLQGQADGSSGGVRVWSKSCRSREMSKISRWYGFGAWRRTAVLRGVLMSTFFAMVIRDSRRALAFSGR